MWLQAPMVKRQSSAARRPDRWSCASANREQRDQCGRARPLVWQSSHDATAVWRGMRCSLRTLWVTSRPGGPVDHRPLPNAWSGHACAAAPLAQTRQRRCGRESPASPESAGEPLLLVVVRGGTVKRPDQALVRSRICLKQHWNDLFRNARRAVPSRRRRQRHEKTLGPCPHQKPAAGSSEVMLPDRDAEAPLLVPAGTATAGAFWQADSLDRPGRLTVARAQRQDRAPPLPQCRVERQRAARPDRPAPRRPPRALDGNPVHPCFALCGSGWAWRRLWL
jgi:hypothetical protein